MKRGFLNTTKAKQQAEAVHSTPEPGPSKKVKVRADATSPAKTKEAITTSQINPGTQWVDYTTPDLHKLPVSFLERLRSSGGAEKRKVFRVWPRDPKGKPLKATDIHGKQAGGGIDLWGATLYDFYHVRRIPDVPHLITISTGSKLARSMRALGELDAARDEIEWADREEAPKEIHPADIGELVECYEDRVHTRVFRPFSMRKITEKEVNSDDHASAKEGELDMESEAAGNAMANAEEEQMMEGNEVDSESKVGTSEEKTDGNDPREVVGNAIEIESTEKCEGVSGEQDDRLDGNVQPTMGDQQRSQSKKPDESNTPGGHLPASESPFDPSYYPSPWPITPCVYPHPLPRLQKRIPHHLLPKKLHVHDPWNLLSVHKADRDRDTPWAKKKDIVHTYSLSLTDEARKAADRDELIERIAEHERIAKRDGGVLHCFPQADQAESGPTEWPMVEVALPPRPPQITSVPDAHLYLSPINSLGTGNHSVVYKADWELPRDLLVPDHLCQPCIIEKVKEELARWEEAQDEKDDQDESDGEGGGPVMVGKHKAVGTIAVEHTIEPGVSLAWHSEEERGRADSVSATKMDVDVDITAEGEATAGIETTAHSMYLDTQDVGGTHMNAQGEDEEKEEFLPSPSTMDTSKDGVVTAEAKGKLKEVEEASTNISEGKGTTKCEQKIITSKLTLQHPIITRTSTYSGKIHRFTPDVQWQNPSRTLTCEHLSRGGRPSLSPRTAKVEVAVKLSIQHDTHLAREAENYQNFAPHLFEHWNGYNVVPPLHDPVPVGAVVPQFYGYYKPDKPVVEKGSQQGGSYLSPILLLEHCGKPINPDRLSLDDKHECASLLFRFHYEGWMHESFAARNILRQRGKPEEWPSDREVSEHQSFRLIDFGRSRYTEDNLGNDRAAEENTALKLLGLHYHAR
ncbi:hypothetical protein BV22DRAFT_1051156 [Leucogyrophana mollusca]|uniref:Uncharacterized protein n=1 Tax=Leucogyrophana mollusca TaxID=85980 RepID=A0ACB8B0S3_9AGAM|nr:hypothetical protein BV22DRAFT_1051156 [Leucogyrophana mollusca]